VRDELDLRRGWVGEELAAEFPELALFHTTVSARAGRSPRAVKDRLRAMSDRFTGPKAIQVRQQPVPWAYRVFFRQIGIDPDHHRTPAEAAALERMRAGAFASRNLLDDALVIATVETGVPVLAYDAERLDGDPGLRLALAGERLGGDGRDLRGGEMVVADAVHPLAVLFGDMAEQRAVRRDTERILVAAVRVQGVPDVSVEEALWIAVETLTEPE
jgi:DNA/RNA-binding domain of Phe-tRNA-synthetase-like protein